MSLPHGAIVLWVSPKPTSRANGNSSAMLPLYDPPREDSKATIDTAKQMGVRVKMVTGDQVAIGKEIAKQVGLGPNILDASLFDGTNTIEGGQLDEAIEKADGFAQVYPEHKYHIVEVLQNRGHVVGMTGDGVNDAPALKKADAGIAVSGATDAARSAADIVLLSPGPVGHHPRHPGKPQDFSADAKLCDLSHRRNHPGVAVYDPFDSRL